MPDAARRISPLALPEAYRLPTRPDGAEAAVVDAHRQARFLLGADLRLIERGMNLQLAILSDSRPVPYRTVAFAALAMPWSRAYALERDAMALALEGAYASCAPLVRDAAEAIAVQGELQRTRFVGAEAWLAGVGEPDEERRGSIMPGHAIDGPAVGTGGGELARVRRTAAMAAGMAPSANLLHVASDSNRQRIAVTFGERGFHLGWAEITFGWLLALIGTQLELAAGLTDVLNVTAGRAAECAASRTEAAGLLGRGERCRFEEAPVQGTAGGDWIVHNFRRGGSGSPRRIVLRT